MTAPDGQTSNSPDTMRPLLSVLWLALAIVFCLHVVSRLVEQSMLLDGTIYAAIARNFAAGEGSWWHLHFSNTLFPFFTEHPPLLIWLEAIGFGLFGDTIAVEKGFSCLTALVNGIILLGIWRQLNRGHSVYRDLGVVALILTLVSGRIGAALANGLIENLLMIFTSLAVLLILTAYGSAAKAGRVLRGSLIVCAGLATVLALLTKGPVGLFPIAVPAIYWAVFRVPPLLSVVVDTAILVVVIVGSVAALMLFDAPHQYVVRYASDQLFSSLSGARGNYGGGWKALIMLLSMMIYALSLAGVFGLISLYVGPRRPAGADSSAPLARNGIFLFVVGLAASLPLFVSPRISSFYFNPSLEYFATALACVCLPSVLNVLQRLDARSLRRLQLVLCAGVAASLVLVVAHVGRPGRDRDLIADAAHIAAYVCPSGGPCERSISACDSVWEEWELHAYLQRNHRIDLAKASTTPGRRLVLTNADCAMPAAVPNSEVDIGLTKHRLFRIEAAE